MFLLLGDRIFPVIRGISVALKVFGRTSPRYVFSAVLSGGSAFIGSVRNGMDRGIFFMESVFHDVLLSAVHIGRLF